MYAFSSKSGSEPFRALGDLTWNDPACFSVNNCGIINKTTITNILFLHKILNISSFGFNSEVRITTHFVRFYFSTCK